MLGQASALRHGSHDAHDGDRVEAPPDRPPPVDGAKQKWKITTPLCHPIKNQLIHRCEQNANTRNYSNPKTRNRYLDAALNARRKAIKRLDALLHKFFEAKPNSA